MSSSITSPTNFSNFAFIPEDESKRGQTSPPSGSNGWISPSTNSLDLSDEEVFNSASDANGLVKAGVKEGLERILKAEELSRSLSSKRATLFKLANINISHYSDQIEKALDLLIESLESDPLTKESSNGIVLLGEGLGSQFLGRSDIKNHNADIQLKLVKAFYLSIELILRHYEHDQKHVGAIPSEFKKTLDQIKEGFEGIIKTKKTIFSSRGSEGSDPYHEYIVESTEQAIRCLTDDKSNPKKLFSGLKMVATALQNLYNKDLKAFLEQSVEILVDLKKLLKADWYRSYYFIKSKELDAIQGSLDELSFIQTTIRVNSTRKKIDPNAFLGGVEALHRIAKYTVNPNIKQMALFGQLGRSESFPGLITLLERSPHPKIRLFVGQMIVPFWSGFSIIEGNLLTSSYNRDELLGPLFQKYHSRFSQKFVSTSLPSQMSQPYEETIKELELIKLEAKKTEAQLKEACIKVTNLEIQLQNANSEKAQADSNAKTAMKNSTEVQKELQTTQIDLEQLKEKLIKSKNELETLKTRLIGLEKENQQYKLNEARLLERVERKEMERPLVPATAFGRAEWMKHIGDVGEEPSLPSTIHQLLTNPCPFTSGVSIGESHILILIPEKINGEPMTISTLGKFIKRLFPQAQESGYRQIWNEIVSRLGDQPIGKSYWILMTKSILPGSTNVKYVVQENLVASAVTKSRLEYQVPKLLEAAVAIVTNYFRTKERLYGNEPPTYTSCQENFEGYRVVVGGLSEEGLDIDGNNTIDNENSEEPIDSIGVNVGIATVLRLS